MTTIMWVLLNSVFIVLLESAADELAAVRAGVVSLQLRGLDRKSAEED